jgi:chromosome segregation ATPase
VNERFERRAERAARAAQSDQGRLDALERRVEEAASVLTAAVEAQASQATVSLGDGLAEVRAALAAVAAAQVDRMDGLEEQAQRNAAEMSALAELQAALDSGLGDLRRQILAAQAGNQELRSAHADLDHRVNALRAIRAAALPPVETERRGRKSADAGGQVAAVSGAVQDLLADHLRLTAELADLGQTAEGAAATAKKASSQASALAPLRSEVRALHAQLADQAEVLEGLTKSVERLRRSKPAASKAPAATKRAPRAAKS